MEGRPVLDELALALAGLPVLGEWVEDAACGSLGAGADVFTADHPDVEELAYAEAMCWRCPVRQECADYAAQAPVYGLWGATWHRTRTSRHRRQAA